MCYGYKLSSFSLIKTISMLIVFVYLFFSPCMEALCFLTIQLQGVTYLFSHYSVHKPSMITIIFQWSVGYNFYGISVFSSSCIHTRIWKWNLILFQVWPLLLQHWVRNAFLYIKKLLLFMWWKLVIVMITFLSYNCSSNSHYVCSNCVYNIHKSSWCCSWSLSSLCC